MFTLAVPAWQLIARSAAIYLALMLGLRLFGKREVGQFTLFDLAMVLLISNAVQPAMTGPDTSLTGGLIIIATLLIVNFVIAYLRSSSPFAKRIFVGQPVILAQDGRWLMPALRRQGVTLDDCNMALREHGLAGIDEAKLVVLETDGTISVVPKDGSVLRGRKRVIRQRKFM
jgi:uncharacterized membrane protein YcaP (DUF421 family)